MDGRVIEPDGDPVAGATVMITESIAPHSHIAQIKTQQIASISWAAVWGVPVVAHLPDGHQEGVASPCQERNLEHDRTAEA